MAKRVSPPQKGRVNPPEGRRLNPPGRTSFEELSPGQQGWLTYRNHDVYLDMGDQEERRVAYQSFKLGRDEKYKSIWYWVVSKEGPFFKGLIKQGAIGIRKSVPVEALKALGIKEEVVR